jgi:hypothetical protein
MKIPDFQYYPARVNTKKPLGFINLVEFVESVKNPSVEIRAVFAQIAQAEIKENWDLKAKLKQENLYYFTPCVFSNWQSRAYKDIDYFTGIAVLDFDHIDNAEAFRDYVFNKYPFVWVAFVSSSKRGVKFLIKIPKVNSIEDFKAYFYGLGFNFDKYKGFDGTPQNCVLPLFLSYDTGILYREEPKTWNIRGAKLNAFKAGGIVELPKDFKASSEDASLIHSNIRKAFDAIVSNGHPQVIAACVSLGGYVSSGYLPQHEAEALAFNLIESNGYLRKGVSGYKKTAQTAIIEGMKSNLILKEKNI